MNKTTLYIIGIVALIVIAILFYLQNEKNTLDTSLTSFALEKEESPDSIVLKQDTAMVTLALREDRWIVNGYLPARNRTVVHLFNVFHNLKIEAPATASAKKNVVDLVKENAIHVKLYENGKKIRDFFVEDSPYKKGHTYMMMSGAEEPFLMNLPGHSGDIAPLLRTDPNYWRSRVLFDYSGIDLSRVKVLYPESPSKSFILEYTKDDEFILEIPSEKKRIKNVNNEKSARYLSYFSDVRYEKILTQSGHLIDSLRKTMPYCEIHVTDIEGKTRVLRTYRKLAEKQTDEFGQKSYYDLNHIYGLYDNFGEILLIKYTEIDPLFKEIDYFRVQ